MKTKSLIQTTTSDLGLAIRDHIEGKPCQHFDDKGTESGWAAVAEFIACDDPNNLFVHMSNGRCFRVSITAV